MKPPTDILICAGLLVVVGVIMIWAAMNRYTPKEDGYDDHAGSSEKMELDREIAPFQLTDSREQTFDTATLEGEVWVASFFFTSCPSICKLQNQQIAILQDEFAEDGVQFVSITCDPVNDTPEALQKYADAFGAKEGTWHFLTGEMEQLKSIVEDSFLVFFETQTHSDRLMVIDKSGTLRGTFRATQDSEFQQAKQLIKKLLAQPYDSSKEDHTNDDDASTDSGNTGDDKGEQDDQTRQQTMASFQLTDSLEQPFDSQSLEGNVWLGSFFYTSCPGACRMQNLEIARLRNEYKERGIKFVSITCDPETDTPATLAGYASIFEADPNRWYFVRGEFDYIQKIGDEFFDIEVSERYHSDRVFLVDQKGKVLDSFRTSQEDQMKEVRAALDKLLPPNQDSGDSDQPEPETANSNEMKE